jgi:redox-sensitive bicupin YhaK (pirin superfamily)
MPTLRAAGGVVSVLVGAVGAAQADIPADGDTTMAHVRVEGGLTIEVPTGTEAFLLGLRGEGEVDGDPIGAHMASAPMRSGHLIRAMTLAPPTNGSTYAPRSST